MSVHEEQYDFYHLKEASILMETNLVFEGMIT